MAFLPPIVWKKDGDEITQLKNYVMQLEEQIRYVLGNLGAENMAAGGVSEKDLTETLRTSIVETKTSAQKNSTAIKRNSKEIKLMVSQELLEKILSGDEEVDAIRTATVLLNAEGFYVDTTGEIVLTSGSRFHAESGKVEIESSDEDSYIRFGSNYNDPTFFVAPGGDVMAKTILADDVTLRENGLMKYLTGSLADKLIVSATAPDAHDVIWLQPNATSDKVYASPSNVSSSRGGSTGDYTISVSFTVSNSGGAITGNMSYGVKASIKNVGDKNTGTECYWRRTVITITGGGNTVTIDRNTNQYIAKGAAITFDNINDPVSDNANLTAAASLTVTAVFHLSKYINYSVNGTEGRVRCKSDAGSGQQACSIYYLP